MGGEWEGAGEGEGAAGAGEAAAGGEWVAATRGTALPRVREGPNAHTSRLHPKFHIH